MNWKDIVAGLIIMHLLVGSGIILCALISAYVSGELWQTIAAFYGCVVIASIVVPVGVKSFMVVWKRTGRKGARHGYSRMHQMSLLEARLVNDT